MGMHYKWGAGVWTIFFWVVLKKKKLGGKLRINFFCDLEIVMDRIDKVTKNKCF